MLDILNVQMIRKFSGPLSEHCLHTFLINLTARTDKPHGIHQLQRPLLLSVQSSHDSIAFVPTSYFLGRSISANQDPKTFNCA
jgi:hypothetical protein